MGTIAEEIFITDICEEYDDFSYNFTIDELNKVSEKIVDKGIEQICEALDKANLDASDLDLIILAGGSSQLPIVYDKIKNNFNIEPRFISRNLMLAISYGASLYQRGLAQLPKLKNEIKTLGYTLDLNVNQGNRSEYEILFNYNVKLPCSCKREFIVDLEQDKFVLRLVSMSGINDSRKKELKRKSIDLPEGHSDKITIEIHITENKLIECTAYDSENPKLKSKMIVDSKLNMIARSKYRKKLGLNNGKDNIIDSDIQQPFIGIDLGTTTSEVTYVNRFGEAELKYIENPDKIPEEYSNYCFPSVVFFKDGNKEIEVSNTEACNAKLASNYRGKVFYEYKVEDVEKSLGVIDGEDIRVKDLSALALNKIWNSVKHALPNVNCDTAVITVPASFNPDQCEMTYEAARIAGIENVTLIDEPTAAFLYYQFEQGLDNEDISKVLVFDFGGGTTDVAILDVKTEISSDIEYKRDMFSVLANVGSSECGGKFIDEAIYNYLEEKVIEQFKKDLCKGGANLLKIEAEKVKVRLSEKYNEEGDYDEF